MPPAHSWSAKVSPMTMYHFKMVGKYTSTQKEKEQHSCEQPH